MLCRIAEGGGMLFTDDLWTCSVCGHEKYPEDFSCPMGEPKPHAVRSGDRDTRSASTASA